MRLSRAQFEFLYDERRLEVYRYLVSFQLSPAEAQDLTQEAFLRLFQETESGMTVANPRAWLFRVAHNLAIDLQRKQPPSIRPVESVYVRTTDDSPEIAVLGKERTRLLVEAIAGLSKQQRACLHLRAEGLRYREIAEVLGISTPTVGEFLQRAIKRMRAAIYG